MQEAPIRKHLSDAFPVYDGLKHGDDLSSLPIILLYNYAIWKVQESQKGVELNDLNEILVYVDDVNLLDEIK
jgi:hypothetical protein